MKRRSNFVFADPDALVRIRLAAAAVIRADQYGRLAVTFASCEELAESEVSA
ncbi:MAG: hypothetical protein JWP32_2883 [Schumannella sp.]|nr:hypothetical protein [Schumannella sp.]